MSSVNQDVFHFFDRLPTELQLLIWQASSSSPRLIRPYKDGNPKLLDRDHQNPSILFVSRRWREWAIANTYTPVNVPQISPRANPAAIQYFDFKQDLFLWEDHPAWASHVECDSQWATCIHRKIQNLVIGVDSDFFGDDDLELKRYTKAIQMFPRLRRLLLVSMAPLSFFETEPVWFPACRDSAIRTATWRSEALATPQALAALQKLNNAPNLIEVSLWCALDMPIYLGKSPSVWQPADANLSCLERLKSTQQTSQKPLQIIGKDQSKVVAVSPDQLDNWLTCWARVQIPDKEILCPLISTKFQDASLL